MKKLLGLVALATILVLAACGGSSTDETVCTVDMPEMSMTITAQSEDGDITSMEVVMRLPLIDFELDASDVDLESDEMQAMLRNMNLEGDFDIDGDYLVVTNSGTAAELGFGSTIDEEFTIDEFIEGAEGAGAICN